MQDYNRIYWKDEQTNNGQCENKRADYDKLFVNSLADYLVDKLKITWKDKQLFKDMLTTILEPLLTSRDSLLEQYLHSQLDIIVKTFKSEFKNKLQIEEMKVDYGNATHAKFNTVIEKIKSGMVED